MSEGPPIALIHLPRTAGSSLGSALAQSFGSRAYRLKQPGLVPKKEAQAIPAETDVVYGHMSYGLHLHVPVRYGTLLRDPIDRYLSHFQLYKKQTTREGRAPPSYQDFLRQAKYHNVQTRMLAGTQLLLRASSYDLLLAKQHLEQFAYVGFYDELDSFAAALGVTMPSLRINRTKRDAEQDEAARDAARRVNRWDLELYDWAKEQFANSGPCDPARTVRPGDDLPTASRRHPLALMEFQSTAPGLDAEIGRTYGARAFPLTVSGRIPPALAAILPKDVELFFGQMNYGLHMLRPVRYAAVLREPIERALSQYALMHTKLAATGHVGDFEQFAISDGASNPMTRRLAGTYRQTPVSPGDLEIAKERLANFEAVGFYSELASLAEAIGVETPKPERVRAVELTPGQLATVRRYNAMDTELYQWARERFAGPIPASLI